MRREDVFKAIRAERKRQDKLHPGGDDWSAAEWAAILAEECGEAIKELNALQWGEDGHTNEQLVTELVHTAAVAVRILETLRHAELPKATEQKEESAPEMTEKGGEIVKAEIRETPDVGEIACPVAEKKPEQTPVKSKRREKLERFLETPFRGFVHLRCKHCGAVKTFCAKVPMTEYTCRECGAVTELTDKTLAIVDCKCGSWFRYQTNITDYAVEIPCLNCGSPNDLIYNPRNHRFQPPEYSGKKGTQKK